MTEENQERGGGLPCPECAHLGIVHQAKDARALGTHRSFKHGVRGSSKSVVAHRLGKAQGKAGRKRMGRPPGSKNAKKATHPAIVIKPSANHPSLEMTEDNAAMVAYAVGKLESLAEQIARENKLPEKAFVRSVARYFVLLSEE